MTPPSVVNTAAVWLGRRRIGPVGRAAVGTGLLNGVTLVLNFAITLTLSRLLGADGYGAYAFAFGWATIFAALAGLGLSPLVVRYMAAYDAQEQWDSMRGLLRRANQAVALTAALTIAAAAAIGAWLLADDRDLRGPYLVALALVPLVALTGVRQCALQGLHRVLLARLPETVVAPGLFLAFVVLAAIAADRVDSTAVLWLQVGAVAAAFVLGAALLRRALPAGVRRARPRFEGAVWARSAGPLFALGVLLAANAQVGTIVLGTSASAEEAGIFSVAARVTTFIGFVMLAATYPLMPAVARLHAAGDDGALRRTVSRAATVIFAASLPIALVVLAIPEPILRVFGSDFPGGVDAVRILAAGEAVKACVGLAGLALVMTGHEADLTRSVAAGALANVGLALVLVPQLGVEGAAIAAAAGGAGAQLLLTWLAWRRLRVVAIAFVPQRGAARAGVGPQ